MARAAFQDRVYPKTETIISKEWIDFLRTSVPVTKSKGGLYAGQWWLVLDTRKDVPEDMYGTAVNRGHFVVIVPGHDLVIVRRGMDYDHGRHAFDRWEMRQRFLQALPKKINGVSAG